MSIGIIFYQIIIALIIVGTGFSGSIKGVLLVSALACAWTFTHVVWLPLFLLQFCTIGISVAVSLVICLLAKGFSGVPKNYQGLVIRGLVVLAIEILLFFRIVELGMLLFEIIPIWLLQYIPFTIIELFLTWGNYALGIIILIIYLFLEVFNNRFDTWERAKDMSVNLYGLLVFVGAPLILIWAGNKYIDKFGADDGIGIVMILISGGFLLTFSIISIKRWRDSR